MESLTEDREHFWREENENVLNSNVQVDDNSDNKFPIGTNRVDLMIFLLVPFLILVTKGFGKIYEMISKLFFHPSKIEKERRTEANEIKAKMSSLSVVDDFASYSKLQRRLNLITVELDSDVGARQALRKNLARGIGFLFYGIVAMIYLGIINTYGIGYPVIYLPETMFYPLNFLLKLTSGTQAVVITLPVWTLSNRYFFSLCHSLL